MQGLYWSLSCGPVVSPLSGPVTSFGRRRPQGGRGSPFFNLQLALRVLPMNPFLSPFHPYHDFRRFFLKIFFILIWFSADEEKEGGIHSFLAGRSPMASASPPFSTGLDSSLPHGYSERKPLKPPKGFLPVPKRSQYP